MQIYFHSCLCSYLPRVPILVEDTVMNLQYDQYKSLIHHNIYLLDYVVILHSNLLPLIPCQIQPGFKRNLNFTNPL